FSNIQLFGSGIGATINTQLQTGNQLLIKDSEFIQCKSYDSNGGAIYLNIDNGGQATISNSSFNQCEAYSGGGIHVYLFNENSILELVNLNFENCSAEYGGGLDVQIYNGGQLSITGSTSFQNCESNQSGGGFYLQIQGGNVNFSSTDQIIFDNCKGKHGGGLLVIAEDDGQLSISSSILFNNCKSINIDNNGYGGGFYLQSNGSESSILITGQIKFENCSSYLGGGMYIRIYNQSTAKINNTSFKDCSGEKGGGIYFSINEGGQISIKDQCLFRECKSISNNGGGIYSYIYDGTINIQDTTFDICTCTQPGNGGALCLIQESSSIIFIINSSFINCKTILNPLDQSYGWGGAIRISTSITAENLNESNFLMRDLIFSGCSAVNSIGNNIHIESVNTVATGESIKNGNLLTVNETTNLYENKLYGSDYMGIDESKTINGNAPISNHEPLFVNPPSQIFLNPYLVNAFDGIDNVFCGESDMPQAEADNYSKQPISTSSFSNSLLTISETGDLSLLGLHFDNLNPSSTNALMSITSSDNTQQPKITIIDCEFNQDSSFYSSSNSSSSSSLSHSIISINGGQMIQISKGFQPINYTEIIESTFSNIQLSEGSNGLIINAHIYKGSLLKIQGCQFIECKGSTYGAAIFLFLNNEGQTIISNSSFIQCEANDGGGVYAVIFSGGQMIIDGQCKFTECKASNYGGGIWVEFHNLNDQFTIEDGVKLEDCTSTWGGGIYLNINNGCKANILNQCLFRECKSISGNGGGIYSYINNGTVNIDDTIFDSCTSTQPGDGGALCLIQGELSIISITNSSFINCKIISNSSDQSFGWGGAIRISTSITSENLNESNFLMRDLIFSGCSAVNSIGNNLHIISVNTLSTGEAIKNGNLLTVKDISNPPNIISDLYTSLQYAYDYMGINDSIESSNPGTTNLDLHNPLFEQSFTSNVPNPTYIDSINGKDLKFCGQLQIMCQTIKYAIDRNPTPLSGNPPPDINYSIIMTSNTELDTDIQINSTTLHNGYIIIKSDEYSPEAGNDIYIKRLISTSSFSNFLFTISETGNLSLLGLHFDNLNPSSTNALMSITSSDNAQEPNITIIDCKFNQDSSSYLSSSSNYGGGLYSSIYSEAEIIITNTLQFINCEGSLGGGWYAVLNEGSININPTEQI
ncbi:MAG: hypothetical protein EZS28_025311, partial [Streblomastix strix]